MKPAGISELIVLSAIWGASFLFMRIAVPELGPFVLMALRTGTAALFLIPLLFIYQQHSYISGNWHKIIFSSLFNTAIPFVLFGYATLTLSAGVTSVLNATTPMFAAVIAFLWLNDRLSRSSILGLAIGFLGVYLLMANKISTNPETVLLPTLATLGATFCYGFGANYTKKYLSGVKPLALAASSQISATLVLLPFSLANLPATFPSTYALLAVILLGIVCTGIAYILFFRLISDLGPAKAVSVTYLIPVFGLLWGFIFLDEHISGNIILGCGVILTGVGLVTGKFQLLWRSIVAKKVQNTVD